MKNNYMAYLSDELTNCHFPAIVYIPSIADAKDGFWINMYHEFTRDDDCRTWIPSCQIAYVQKRS